MRARCMHFVVGLLLALALTGHAAAQELRPFKPDSLAQIESEHTGRPFILSFWSLTCPPCRDELALLSQLEKQYPGLDLVLVSTDTPDERDNLQATLDQMKIQRIETWVFSDSFDERLRFEVDKKWHGELPRTYFYAPGKPRTAESGKLSFAEVTQWIERHASHMRNR
jgi:thiol-disulfide isomerase/thioredoxin